MHDTKSLPTYPVRTFVKQILVLFATVLILIPEVYAEDDKWIDGIRVWWSNYGNTFKVQIPENQILAKKMNHLEEYNVSIKEIHHINKKDKPSGTAITLSNDINKILKNKTTIKSSRIAETTGLHKITYSSQIDEIEIKHTANNRVGFAIGAIMAAEWIKDKKGIYSMQDVLKIK